MTYPNRYVRATGWKRLDFLSGRGLQAAELNEIQAILGDELHQLGRTVWADGQVVRGVELDVEPGAARLSQGQVYFRGFFHDFPGGEVAIDNSGREIIGLRFSERYISESDDNSLYDPSGGMENSGHAGAHRLVYEIEVTRNEANAVPLYALQDGVFAADYRPPTQASDIARILARRTYDESGDYLVQGLRCTLRERNDTQFWVEISAGKAYVHGTEHTIPTQTRVAIDRPTDYVTVLDEQKTYQTGTNLYLLASRPVRQIFNVTATVQRSLTGVIKGAAGGMDYLAPYVPVVSLVSVTQGATTYVPGTDYLLTDNSVDWSPGGAEPSSGSSYTVVLRYTKQMDAGVDFTQTGESLDFSPTGDNPVDQTPVYVDYQYYVSRHDLVVMNPQGEIKVIRGVPGLFPRDPSPPANALPIAAVNLVAGFSGPEAHIVAHSERYRLTMAEIAALRQRIDDIEYNLAVDDLEQAAINVDLPTSKIGIFTDSFRDSSKMDSDHPLFSCSFGLSGDGLDTLYPPFATQFHPLQDAAAFLHRAYSHVATITQGYATESINVNPYAAYNNAGILTLTPAADIWIDVHWIRRFSGQSFVTPFRWWEEWIQTTRTLLSDVQISGGTPAEKVVRVDGSGFQPYSNNLALVFNDTDLGLTPVAPTLGGTDPETVRANEHGAFSATFTVPQGTINGTHQVLVYNEDNRGSTQYRIDGRLQTWLENNTLIRHIEGQPLDTNDPIAQSFTVDYDQFISGVDLFFAQKDDTIPIVVSIRNTVNGYPGPRVLAEQTIAATDVMVSTDSSVATQVRFTNPIYVQADQEYAVVVTTLSQRYYLFLATLGENDLLTGSPVLKNPASGVMFSSANNAAWTAHQRSDLKVTLYRANFGTDTTVLTFPPDGASPETLGITPSCTRLCLFAAEILPVGTSITWEVALDGGSWRTVPVNVDLDMGVSFTSIRVRATLMGTTSLTPIVHGSLGAIATRWAGDLVYSHNTVTLPEYTEIDVYVDANVPNAQNVSVIWYNGASDPPDPVLDWTWMGMATPVRAVNAEWTEYHIHYELPGPPPASGPDSLLKIALIYSLDAGSVVFPRYRRLRVIAR